MLLFSYHNKPDKTFQQFEIWNFTQVSSQILVWEQFYSHGSDIKCIIVLLQRKRSVV